MKSNRTFVILIMAGAALAALSNNRTASDVNSEKL